MPVKGMMILPALFFLACGTTDLVAAKPDQKTGPKNDESFGDAVDKAIDNESDVSAIVDRWYQAYSKGESAKADKLWDEVLTKRAKDWHINYLLRNIVDRPYFAESSLSEQKIFEHLLERTTRKLGPNHRFVGNLLAKLAPYAEMTHDYKKAIAIRKRVLTIFEKSLGPDDKFTVDAIGALAHEYMLMKDYSDAEPLLKRSMTQCLKTKNEMQFRESTREYINLLQATSRQKEATQVIAKYKTYMWRN